MRNNRLNQEEISKLKEASGRLKKLAKLESARFSIDEEKDKKIKADIRSYMMWFELVAGDIDWVLEERDNFGIRKQNKKKFIK